MANLNDKFSALSMKDRAELINIYVKGGMMDLKEIKAHYNSLYEEEPNKYGWGGASKEALGKAFGDASSTVGSVGNIAGSAMTMVSNGMENAEINTTEADNAIEAVKSYKLDNSSLDALANSYNSTPWAATDYDSSDFTKSGWEIAGNTFESTLSGITAGASVGGPWGAVIGGLAGLGSGLIGWGIGESKAEEAERRLEAEAKKANRAIELNAVNTRDSILQQQANNTLRNIAADGGRILNGTETEQTTTSESHSKKHVEDVVRTTRGATGKFILSEYPYVDTEQLRYLVDSWKVMRGNNDYVAPKDDNYTGTAIKDGKLQTDNDLGFATQKELEDKLGYVPKDFVDTYVYGDIPFEELGVFKKDVSPERHILRSKIEKVENSGKSLKTYQTHKDTLDTKQVAYFDKLLSEGLVDLHSENTTHQNSPFRIGDSGIIYDGNNSTVATVYLPNGQPVSKAIDVFDTDPTEWNYNVGPLSKTGLKFIHDNTNPFIMTTPWYYPEGSSDEANRLENLFGIVINPDDYYMYYNTGDKNGVKWTLDEALAWIRSHPDLTEIPKKSKKSKEKFGN